MIIYDRDIRIKLYQKIVSNKEFYIDKTTKIIDEMGILNGSSKVDVAVINGKLHGYEIKSERDTLDRLPLQSKYYNTVFDKMTIVCSDKYLKKIEAIIPKWWGILEVRKNKKSFTLVKKRNALLNPNVDISSISKLLWRDEMIEILEQKNIKKIKSKTKLALVDIITNELPPQEIKDQVRYYLKNRKEWRGISVQKLNDDLQNR